MLPFLTLVRIEMWIRIPQLVNCKEGIYVNSENIKQEIDLTLTFILESKLQKEHF